MRTEEKLFFVRANGEDLGIMTMRDAFRWSWSQSEGQHASLSFEPVKELSPMETV